MIIEVIKRNRLLDTSIRKAMAAITRVSPKIASQLYFFKEYHHFANLKKPVSFNEKLMALKLGEYRDNPLITQCADKYAVRDYVSAHGCGDTLTEFYGVWEKADDIDWDAFPQRFVIKCNHGCGYNIVCTDKSTFDFKSASEKLDKWMEEEFWIKKAEVNYKNIKHKIICEEYIDDGTGDLPTDYKIYCFHGVPRAILVISDRDSDKRGVFMSPDWTNLGTPAFYKPVNKLPECPASLQCMIEVAEKLSEPFPFVRVDLYQGKNRAVFGELTFTPGDCLHPAQIDLNGKSMGNYINI